MRGQIILVLLLGLQELIGAGPVFAADSRYSIHTSGLNSSVYVNMLYFANLVNHTPAISLWSPYLPKAARAT